jgi:hypothetical protein
MAIPSANLPWALETAIRFNDERYGERDYKRLSFH